MSRRKRPSNRKHVLSMAQAGQTPPTQDPKPPATPAPAAPPTPPPAYASGLPLKHRHAAGIDVGSFSHWVSVGPDPEPREFPAHTDGLKQIVAWLHQQQITTVALESSGIYWIARYELLQSEGFEVLLVDPSFTKQIKGRPKTDKHDCQ